MHRPIALATVAVAGVLAMGCVGNHRPRGAPARITSSAAPNAAFVVKLPDDARAQCPLPESVEVERAGQRPKTNPAIDALATCLTTGPLAGTHVKIVAHTPWSGPRGYQYNVGLTHAEDLKHMLMNRGVGTERVETVLREAPVDQARDTLDVEVER